MRVPPTSPNPSSDQRRPRPARLRGAARAASGVLARASALVVALLVAAAAAWGADATPEEEAATTEPASGDGDASAQVAEPEGEGGGAPVETTDDGVAEEPADDGAVAEEPADDAVAAEEPAGTGPAPAEGDETTTEADAPVARSSTTDTSRDDGATAAEGPVRIVRARMSGSRLLPWVRDGIDDTVAVRVATDRPGRARIDIRNAAGSRVRWAHVTTRGLRADGTPRVATFRWNGRAQGGRLLRPGRFTVSVSAWGPDQSRATTARPGTISVRRGWRRVTRRVVRHGMQLRRRVVDACITRRSSRYAAGLYVRCLGGAAAITWDAPVPRRARNVSMRISGVATCCSGPTSGRTVVRQHRGMRATASLLQWGGAGMHVRSATFSYTVLVRT